MPKFILLQEKKYIYICPSNVAAKKQNNARKRDRDIERERERKTTNEPSLSILAETFSKH